MKVRRALFKADASRPMALSDFPHVVVAVNKEARQRPATASDLRLSIDRSIFLFVQTTNKSWTTPHTTASLVHHRLLRWGNSMQRVLSASRLPNGSGSHNTYGPHSFSAEINEQSSNVIMVVVLGGQEPAHTNALPSGCSHYKASCGLRSIGWLAHLFALLRCVYSYLEPNIFWTRGWSVRAWNLYMVPGARRDIPTSLYLVLLGNIIIIKKK